VREVATLVLGLFQSTLPARGSDGISKRSVLNVIVSIHAPREGERPMEQCLWLGAVGFQSTLPARGSDTLEQVEIAMLVTFQSTLPARGSDTGRSSAGRASRWFQSTLPARGSDRNIW